MAMPRGPMPAVSPWGITTTAVRRCSRWHASSCSRINFFQGAFGGSFLNHQYLICACAPEYPQPTRRAREALDRGPGHGRRRRTTLPRLKTRDRRRRLRRSMEPPKFAKSGNIAPRRLFRRRQVPRGEHHAAAVSAERQCARGRAMRAVLYADPANATTLPPQTGRHHRRSLGCERHRAGHGTRAPGMRRSPTGGAGRRRKRAQ